MDAQELKHIIGDYRAFAPEIYDEFHQSTSVDMDNFNKVNIVGGEAYELGLRVRVFFNLTVEEMESLDSPYYEWITFSQGMLYYPTKGDWYEGGVHLEYRSEVTEELQNQHSALLRILHKVFWLAYDLQGEIDNHPDISPPDYLKSRAFVDQPEIWGYLPSILKWFDQVNLPKWHPLDLLDRTIHQINEIDFSRKGYVYLLKGAEGWFKIGRSIEPSKRIEKLGVVLPFPIETKHLIITDDMYRLESKLHEIFSHRRGRGEWFALAADEINAICGVQDIWFMPQQK